MEKSDEIHNSEFEYQVSEVNTAFSTHIAPTHLNTFLPPTFYEDTAKGKPEWWVRRFLEGSFENREGLVYPQHAEHIVEPFQIPEWWPKYFGSDFGYRDPTVGIWIALDPKEGILYIYDEHYESGQPIHYHAEKFKERLNEIPFGKLERMIGDSQGQAKGQDGRSIFDHYAEYGVYYEAATKKLEDSIFKMQGYFDLGRIKVFNTLKNTLREFQNYKYPELSLDKDIKNPDIPEDKENHAMDTIRYIIAELPDDPNDLINHGYNPGEMVYNSNREQKHLPLALQETEPNDIGHWMMNY